jgi:four helix bundle protein
VHRYRPPFQEGGMSGTYQDLKVWQVSMQLVYRIYEFTQAFPHHEIYALTNQMRRAAVSIPSNIAEGKGRTGQKELAHFLSNSRGSLHELETQVLIAAHLKYLTIEHQQDLLGRIAEVGRMLSGLISFATENPD